jgi:hypothetical protein
MISLEMMVSILITNELQTRWPKLIGIGEFKKEPEPLPLVEGMNAQGTHIGVFEDNGKTGYLHILDSRTRETLAAC